ncbi:TolC family protein [Sphingobacterium sp. SRCM116780]|uniref:TolC family protein n=1 Tax=Sphingobacterium sp. SRCM116780 TaxID=2907623 RepID=UPI001F2FC545|nr:TolC family protein [Sphingobacterium sp. SRCM116780]UIR55816.1 TolC family protein [Sphingobacterium sp. SRCM116780]
MNKIFCLLSLFFLPLSIAFSQNVLTAQDAVSIAMQNNFDILLTKKDVLISQENLTYGNAGMLPNLTANFSQSNSTQNSKQTQNTGEIKELANAKNNSMNYGVSLGWTIFDGFGMFARYEKLNQLKARGDLELKSVILTTVGDVLNMYYSIVLEKNLLNTIDSSIVISNDRLRTAENRFQIGKASKLEVLNVQVNLNEDQSLRLKKLETITNLKTELNRLMARDLNVDFQVEDELSFEENLKINELLDLAATQNLDLQLIKMDKRLAELEQKDVKSRRLPVVRLNSGYNFSSSESSLGFVSQSNARGLTYGLTASFNIFDGFNQRKDERVAKQLVEKAAIQIEKSKELINATILKAYQSYITNISLARLEEKNEKIAKQNLSITLDKYKIGTISAVEFRDAQENYVNAMSRLKEATYQAKLSEIGLKELVGNLDLH